MAHVMHPGSSHFSGTYIPTVAGWVQANAFYAPVPFNSKPPPVPAGINPQTWQNGHWQPNPMFRPQPGLSQAQPIWAPHPGWGPAIAQPHQAQSNFNPHKRIPNPGDAAYWATKLSDNPLGLENMHIKDPLPTTERHVKEQNGVPHTPWVWVPKELTAEEATKSTYTATNPPSQPVYPQAQQADKVLPPPPPSSSLRDHARAPSASQIPYSNSYPASSQTRLTHQALTPAPPTSASAPGSSYSTYHHHQQLLQQRSQEIQRPSDRYTSTSSQQQQPDAAQHARQHIHNVSSRSTAESQSHRDCHVVSTAPSSSASAAAAARERERTSSGGQEQRTLDRANEAFSQPREMHLTFSPNIIRTPDHYSTPSNSRHTSQDDDHTSSRTPAPHGNIYAPAHSNPPRSAPSRSNSISVRRQSTTANAGAMSGQTTPSSSLGLLTFTEEPQALLSPLVVGSTPPTATKSSPGRDVSRSQSYPLVGNPNYSVAFTGESEREGKVYPRTPRPHENAHSRLEPVDQDYDRSLDRDRSVNVTPQPPTRTSPLHSSPTRTPPSRTSPSYNTRPSPETGSYHARQISRSYTYPSVAPVGAVIPPPVVPPPVIPSPVGSPPSNSTSASPLYGPSSQHYSSSSHPPSRDYSNPSYAQAQPYSSSSSYSGSSYTRTSPNANSTRSRAASPLRHNPLPRPPAVSPYAESLTRGGGSSASAAAAAHQQGSYHNQNKRKVRKGYWNRRGDYLYVTDKGERFIVYAPRPQANPEELKHYPSATDGWLDHHGDFIKYDPKVPELLDSLPVHGEAPKRPYEHFVQYVES